MQYPRRKQVWAVNVKMGEPFRSIFHLISFHMHDTFKRYIRLGDAKEKFERDRLFTTMVYDRCMA